METEYHVTMCVVWVVCVNICKTRFFATHKVLQLHQYTPCGSPRGVVVYAMTLPRRSSAMVAGGVAATECLTVMCVVWVACMHLHQNPLFRNT